MEDGDGGAAYKAIKVRTFPVLHTDSIKAFPVLHNYMSRGAKMKRFVNVISWLHLI